VKPRLRDRLRRRSTTEPDATETLLESIAGRDGADRGPTASTDGAGTATSGAAPAQMEKPCVECGDKRGVRQFSLNPATLPPVGTDDLVAANPHLLRVVVGDRLVVLDRSTAVCHVLNASAGLILEVLDEPRTISGAIAELHTETGFDPAVLAVDVGEAVAAFRTVGLAQVVGVDPEPMPPPELSTVPRADPARSAAAERWAPTINRQLAPVESSVVGPVTLAGTSAEIRTNDPVLAEELTALLASLPRATRSEHTVWVLDRGVDGPRRWRVIVDGEVTATTAEREHAVDALMPKLNVLAVTGSVGRVLLHAGAVELDGRAAVIAGESGFGKSTLTAALVQTGLAYLSDELVALEPDGARVVPYPKPFDLAADSLEMLGLDPSSVAGWGKGRVPPERFGTISTGARVELLVLLASPGSADEALGAEVTVLDPADAVAELMSSTFAETFRRPDALEVLGRMCVTTPVIRLTRMPVADAVTTVRAALG
jgi:hypothetical protein